MGDKFEVYLKGVTPTSSASSGGKPHHWAIGCFRRGISHHYKAVSPKQPTLIKPSSNLNAIKKQFQPSLRRVSTLRLCAGVTPVFVLSI